jgi:arylsulfatase A-like enzyme
MRLLNFNVEAQCTPSRAALMTGRYAVRTGNGSVPIETPVYGLVQWEITMAEMLSDAGYASGAFGKWHLGHAEGRFPTDQGFDEWYGIHNSTDEAFWPSIIPYYSLHGIGFQSDFILPAKNLAAFFKYYDEYSAKARPQGRTIDFGFSWTLRIPKAKAPTP